MKDTDANGCGKCQLCCKIMGVPELKKGRGTWCAKVVKSVGCGCYSQRPTSCQEYECLWLQSLVTDNPLPLELKPSNCGALLNPTKDGEKLVVELTDGIDWKKGKLGQFIAMISETMLVIVRCRDRMWGVRKNQLVFTTLDDSGTAAEVYIDPKEWKDV